MANNLPDKELLRPDEVAKFYSVSDKTVRGWIVTGKLMAVKVVKGWRIHRQDALDLQKPSID
jgi:excisionase family DNA binding protein